MDIFKIRMIRNGFSIGAESDEYICSYGHVFTEKSHNMKHRERRAFLGSTCYSDLCPVCKFNGYKAKLINELVRHGYTLRGDLPSDLDIRKSPLTIVCPQGHVTTRKMEHIRENPRCTLCRFSSGGWFENARSMGIPVVEKTAINRAKILLNTKLYELSISEICKKYSIDPFTIYGYSRKEVLVKGSRSDRDRYATICSKGHEFLMGRRSLMEGHGCRSCSLSTLNEPEKVIGEWIENAGFEIIRRDRGTIGQEMDIYIPAAKIGIEYTGIRWHSLESVRMKYPNKIEALQSRVQDRVHHLLRKKLLAHQSGVNLITILESEYLYDRENLKYRVLEVIAGVRKRDGNLMYDPIDSDIPIIPPRPHYFDRDYREVDEDTPHRYTVYDCGSQYVAMEKTIVCRDPQKDQ